METKMQNIAVIGKFNDDRWEMIQDLIRSIAADKSNSYEVVVIDSTSHFVGQLALPQGENIEEITLDDVDFLTLRTWIITNQAKKQVIVVPELDTLLNHPKFNALLEFLNFISEFGSGIGAYTVLSLRGMPIVIEKTFMERIVVKNTSLYCMFNMDKPEAKVWQEVLNITKSAIKNIMELNKGEYLIFEK